MPVIQHNNAEWIVRKRDIRFTIRKDYGLWKAEDWGECWVGGLPATFEDQFQAVQEWWNQMAAGRELF